MSDAKKRRLKSIEIKRAKHGVIVRHETEPTKPTKSGMSHEYTPPDEYPFNDHQAAAAHIQKHLGELLKDDDADDEAPAAPKDVKPRGRFQRG